MPTAASRTSFIRQVENLLATVPPADTDNAVSGVSSSTASTVASDACLCTRLWLRLAAWYRVHVAYFVRRPSASVTLVLFRGGESHLTHLQFQR